MTLYIYIIYISYVYDIYVKYIWRNLFYQDKSQKTKEL